MTGAGHGGKAWGRVLSKETCVPGQERLLCISRVPGLDLAGLGPRFLTASLLGEPHSGFSSTWCFGISMTKIKAAWLPGPSRARVPFFGWKRSPCLALGAPFFLRRLPP